MTSNSKHSLSESWGVLEQEQSPDETYSDPSISDPSSSDSVAPPPTRRTRRKAGASPRTKNSTPISRRRVVEHQEQTTPRNLRSSTPRQERRTPKDAAEPQFIMPSPYSTPGEARKRARRGSAKSTPITASKVRRRAVAPRVPEQGILDYLLSFMTNVVWPPLQFALDCLFRALVLLKTPISFGLALVLFSATVRWVLPSSLLSMFPVVSTVAGYVASPCSLPLASYVVPWCATPVPSQKNAQFEKLVEIQQSFDKVLSIAQESTPLPLQISMAEITVLETRDLIQYQSQLPSKAELIMHISDYVSDSKFTSKELTDFSSHIGRALDRILSMNRLTLRTLDEFKLRADTTGAVQRVVDLLIPGTRYGRLTEAEVISQYLEHADVVEQQTAALIDEGQLLYLHLQTLDDKLDLIREVINRDTAHLVHTKDELFSRIWTLLGGNVRDRQRLAKNLAIADRLALTTREATRIVKVALDELQRIRNDIEDLKLRVARPRVRARMSALEIEEHIQFVQDGYDRLNQKRIAERTEMNNIIREGLGRARQVFERPDRLEEEIRRGIEG